MPHYGDDLHVAHKTRHTMKQTDNPYCPRCHLRMYPLWGPHQCANIVSNDEIKRTRHIAGDLITNLHFYRVEADIQIAALCEALAFTMAANVHPLTVFQKWEGLQTRMRQLMQLEIDRIQQKREAENLVMDVQRPRLTAKRRKDATRGKRRPQKTRR